MYSTENASGQIITNGYVNSMNGGFPGFPSIGFKSASGYAGKDSIYFNSANRSVDVYYMRRGESITGDNHSEWLKIVAVTSTLGALVPVMSYGSNYVYVNIGFEDGSMNSQISVYAPNW